MMRRLSATLLFLWLPAEAIAIDIGTLTFSMPPEKKFISKQVHNNNHASRVYAISVTGIDRPGNNEVKVRPVDGEIMYTPRRLTLEAGRSDNVRFIYSGPQDDKERYYRVTFREIPLGVLMTEQVTRGATLEPVVALEAILVVRPRQMRLNWTYSVSEGTLLNSGNTWFRLMVKNGCSGSDQLAKSVYLRPGETFRSPLLKGNNKKFIVTESRFIPLGAACFDQAAR
ncbi:MULTISPECIES: fimbria/pilus periplasmic chaperone [Erwinia]|uniref:fimbria/pilus periplasmic chaperone n=1 Tax=Erwinia TaxID=551 RepID=UPI0006900387|nr:MULTISPECIES: fimbria/pilus periplasmic chaperone [Erwinia]